jgi:ceramide synthetase
MNHLNVLQISLWGKEWFWNISDCWTDYPHHSVDRDVWWYYILELSFYWGLFFSQFVDVRRKDFWVNFVTQNSIRNTVEHF